MEQNRKPRIKPLHLWSINRDKEVKNIQRRKDNLQQVVLGEQPATCKTRTLAPYTKKVSKWTKDLNVRPDSTKPLEKT